MNEWTSSIIVLGIALTIIVIFRDKINESKTTTKICIFSVIVSILGNIFGKFDLIGYLIQRIAIVCVAMSIIINVYILIFKSIKGITVKLIFFSLFIFMIFTTLLYSSDVLYYLEDEFFMSMNTGRTISIMMILMLILLKSFQLIFSKDKRKEKSNIDETYELKEVQEQ